MIQEECRILEKVFFCLIGAVCRRVGEKSLFLCHFLAQKKPLRLATNKHKTPQLCQNVVSEYVKILKMILGH